MLPERSAEDLQDTAPGGAIVFVELRDADTNVGSAAVGETSTLEPLEAEFALEWFIGVAGVYPNRFRQELD